MFEGLSRDDKLLLMKFVCAFAWTDLRVRDPEKSFVRRLAQRMGLSGEDTEQVEQWLSVSPAPGSIDPKRIPHEHRRAFLEAVRAVIYVDGEVELEERLRFEQLKAVLDSE